MTVTLRPREPERTTPEGGFRCSYLLCDNGRPIGELVLSTEGDPPRRGRIDHLWVAESERRRGRGGIALLAAEEALRSRGCDRVRARLPLASDDPGQAEDVVAATGLAEAFGYRPLGVDLRRAPRGERADEPGTSRGGTVVEIPPGPGLDPMCLWIVPGSASGAEARFRAPYPAETGGMRGAQVLDAAEEAARAAGVASLVIRTGPGRSPDEAECRERGYRFGHRVVGKHLG